MWFACTLTVPMGKRREPCVTLLYNTFDHGDANGVYYHPAFSNRETNEVYFVAFCPGEAKNQRGLRVSILNF